MNFSRIAIFIAILIISSNICAQTKSSLEIQKKEIQKEIKNIKIKLTKKSSEKERIISNAEDLNYKIDLQKNLINNINTQLNIILEEIEANENKLANLKTREKKLKDELSKSLLSAYKKKSSLNKLMFVFSSTSFQQAYKRIQYFKQYAKFQNKTLSKIKTNSDELGKTINELDLKKNEKEGLINENEKIKNTLSREKEQLNILMTEVIKDQNKYASLIKQKQKLSKEIDEKINKIIKEALAKSNKDEGDFKLTKEAQLISKNFKANKGRLPSPVIRGSVVLGFGKQPHPIVKTATIQSNGVRIRTSSDVEARTIFDGEVYSIIKSKNNTHTILIQHGSFFSVYKNISEIYINKGDRVKTKDSIGKIATDILNGQTILSFSIFNNGIPQNPRVWIYKM